MNSQLSAGSLFIRNGRECITMAGIESLIFYKLCSDVCSDRDVIQDNDDDLIHMGHAIVTFYSALIDLLGRCAPEMHVSVFSRSTAILSKHSVMPDSIEPSRVIRQLPFS